MKKILKNKSILIAMSLLTMTISFWTFSFNTRASNNLDYIRDYTITVDPYFTDGSMEITYDITWEVLDSESEGPLEWVKIGIANASVEEIKPLTDNIKKCSYYDNNGEYVRVDFKDSYEAGEVVHFSFKIRQHRLYTANSEHRIYSFTPGWFNEIEIGQINVYWSKEKIYNYSGSTNLNVLADSEEYYHFSADNLAEGQKINVIMTYEASSFEVEDNGVLTYAANKFYYPLIIILVVILFLIFTIFNKSKLTKTDLYDSTSGMGSIHNSHHMYIHSSSGHGGGHGGGGSGCACACACACAGGGRAGCSKKDFYGTKLETNKMRQIICEKN